MAVAPEVVATIAAIVAGFGVAMLFFRIDRELEVDEGGRQIWIPWADWLLIGATLCAIVIVLLPLLLFAESDTFGHRVPTAGCAAALTSLVGYVLGILATTASSRARLTERGPATTPSRLNAFS